jgi:non-heme chloroperoxidase
VQIVNVEDGVDLHITDWGGTGPPMLFVPCWAATSHIFDEFAPRFTDHHRVLVMNKRGHGPSSRPTHGYTIDRLTKDIEVVLDAFEIEKVNLVGLSRSESIVSHFAADYPNRVSRLVYLSGPIDREFFREFFRRPLIRSAAEQINVIEESICELCEIRVPPRPLDTDDDAADEIGVEWRQTDPAPPYDKIKAPAIAFWAPIRNEIDQYRNACKNVANKAKANELLLRYVKTVPPLYERMDHDMAIFRDQMENGIIFEIPGAHYHAFLTHPDIVEREMKVFLSSKRIDDGKHALV